MAAADTIRLSAPELEELLRQIRQPAPTAPPPPVRGLDIPQLRQGNLLGLLNKIKTPTPPLAAPKARTLEVEVPECWELEDMALEAISLPDRRRRSALLEIPNLKYLWELEARLDLIFREVDLVERRATLRVEAPIDRRLEQLRTAVFAPAQTVSAPMRTRSLDVILPSDWHLRQLLWAITAEPRPSLTLNREIRVAVPASPELAALLRKIFPIRIGALSIPEWAPPVTDNSTPLREAALEAAIKQAYIATRQERAWVPQSVQRREQWRRIRPVTSGRSAETWPSRKVREVRRTAAFPSMSVAEWSVDKREGEVLRSTDRDAAVYPYDKNPGPSYKGKGNVPYLEFMTWTRVLDGAALHGGNPVTQFRNQTQRTAVRIRPEHRESWERKREWAEKTLGFETTEDCVSPWWLSASEQEARMSSEFGQMLTAEIPNELAWGNPDLQAKYFEPAWFRNKNRGGKKKNRKNKNK